MGKSLNRTFAERGLGTFWEVPRGVLVIVKGKAKTMNSSGRHLLDFPAPLCREQLLSKTWECGNSNFTGLVQSKLAPILCGTWTHSLS